MKNYERIYKSRRHYILVKTEWTGDDFKAAKFLNCNFLALILSTKFAIFTQVLQSK